MTPAEHSEPETLACDTLSPRWSHLTTSYGYLEYDAAIGTTLFSPVPVRNPTNLATAEELLIAMVEQTPGYPEDAVYVLRSAASSVARPKYRVIHASAKAFLTTSKASPGATFAEAAADPEMVDALEGVWAKMTLSARWKGKARAAEQVGGPWYFFSYRRDMVVAEGEAVAPGQDSCSGMLAEAGKLLIEFAHATDAAAKATTRERLLNHCAVLAGRFGGM